MSNHAHKIAWSGKELLALSPQLSQPMAFPGDCSLHPARHVSRMRGLRRGREAVLFISADWTQSWVWTWGRWTSTSRQGPEGCVTGAGWAQWWDSGTKPWLHILRAALEDSANWIPWVGGCFSREHPSAWGKLDYLARWRRWDLSPWWAAVNATCLAHGVTVPPQERAWWGVGSGRAPAQLPEEDAESCSQMAGGRPAWEGADPRQRHDTPGEESGQSALCSSCLLEHAHIASVLSAKPWAFFWHVCWQAE